MKYEVSTVRVAVYNVTTTPSISLYNTIRPHNTYFSRSPSTVCTEVSSANAFLLLLLLLLLLLMMMMMMMLLWLSTLQTKSLMRCEVATIYFYLTICIFLLYYLYIF